MRVDTTSKMMLLSKFVLGAGVETSDQLRGGEWLVEPVLFLGAYLRGNIHYDSVFVCTLERIEFLALENDKEIDKIWCFLG